VSQPGSAARSAARQVPERAAQHVKKRGVRRVCRVQVLARLCCTSPHASTQLRTKQPCCRTTQPCWTLTELIRAYTEFGARAQHTSEVMVHTEVSKAAQGSQGRLASVTLRQQAYVYQPCNTGPACQAGRASLAAHRPVNVDSQLVQCLLRCTCSSLRLLTKAKRACTVEADARRCRTKVLLARGTDSTRARW